jgi:uncharacterized protein
MEFKGKYSIPANPERVWSALHDPAVLAASIPGCESVEKISEREFQAATTIKIGPVKARFQGKVQLDELPPPPGVAHAMLLQGEGQGGAAGFARGQSEVRLSASGADTLLEYNATAAIGGRLAQVGQRLIDSAAKSIADEFFGKFAALMRAQVTPAPPAPSAAQAEANPRDEGLAPQIWVAGLIGIIAILLLVFSIVL